MDTFQKMKNILGSYLVASALIGAASTMLALPCQAQDGYWKSNGVSYNQTGNFPHSPGGSYVVDRASGNGQLDISSYSYYYAQPGEGPEYCTVTGVVGYQVFDWVPTNNSGTIDDLGVSISVAVSGSASDIVQTGLAPPCSAESTASCQNFTSTGMTGSDNPPNPSYSPRAQAGNTTIDTKGQNSASISAGLSASTDASDAATPVQQQEGTLVPSNAAAHASASISVFESA